MKGVLAEVAPAVWLTIAGGAGVAFFIVMAVLSRQDRT